MISDIVARGLAAKASGDLAEFQDDVSQALSGKADLVNGKVPADQLPSYVDDVLSYPTVSDFPEEGERDKIYIADDTGFVYRWDGSIYVEINASSQIIEYEDMAHFPQEGESGCIYIAQDTNKQYRWAGDGYAELSADTYRVIPSEWDVNDTTAALCQSIVADDQAKAGMAFFGKLYCSDLPGGLVQAEAVIEIISEDQANGKNILISLTSANQVPYRWEYAYVKINGSYGSPAGWVGYQPELVSGSNIKTINNESLLGSGNLDIHGVEFYDNYQSFPLTGDMNVVYVDKATGNIYRRTGSGSGLNYERLSSPHVLDLSYSDSGTIDNQYVRSDINGNPQNYIITRPTQSSYTSRNCFHYAGHSTFPPTYRYFDRYATSDDSVIQERISISTDGSWVYSVENRYYGIVTVVEGQQTDEMCNKIKNAKGLCFNNNIYWKDVIEGNGIRFSRIVAENNLNRRFSLDYYEQNSHGYIHYSMVAYNRVQSIGGKSGAITLGNGLSINNNNVLSVINDEVEIIQYQTSTPLTDEQIEKIKTGKAVVADAYTRYSVSSFSQNSISFVSTGYSSGVEGTNVVRDTTTYVRTLSLDLTTKLFGAVGQVGVASSIEDYNVNFFDANTEAVANGKRIVREMNVAGKLLPTIGGGFDAGKAVVVNNSYTGYGLTNVKTINNESIFGTGNINTVYSAGTGIDISSNIVSVDNTVAMKSDLPVGTEEINFNDSSTTATAATLDNIVVGNSSNGYTRYNIPSAPEDIVKLTAIGQQSDEMATKIENAKAIVYSNRTYTLATKSSSTITFVSWLQSSSQDEKYSLSYTISSKVMTNLSEMYYRTAGVNGIRGNVSLDASLETNNVSFDPTLKLTGKLPITTDANQITGPNTSGFLTIVVLSEEPTERYDGYLYIITAAPSGYSVTVENIGGVASPHIYDGQSNAGTDLGTLDQGESKTFNITSGYIYVYDPDDMWVFEPVGGGISSATQAISGTASFRLKISN